MEIVTLNIDDLTPYENNTRRHGAEDLKTIVNSISEFGMCDPIGVWGPKNIIVEGHGRLLALRELGYKEVPCLRLDHLSDEQRKAYSMAHNKTAEMSMWDFSKLEAELAEQTIDMSAFGFDMSEFEAATAIDLEDEEEAEDSHDGNLMHCPKCGFVFEVKQ